MGRRVVIYLPDREHPWKAGFLTGLIPGDDKFTVKWSRKGFGRVLIGIWRIHPTVLFRGTNLLPIPRYPARVPESINRSETRRPPKQHHSYKGDDATYGGKKIRARRELKGKVPIECEIEDCSDKPEIHHIDGDNGNNDLSNIRFLCKRHHAQLHGRQKTNIQRDKEGKFSMATRKPAAKASTAKKRPTKAAAADNGAKQTTGRTRGADKLAGLSDAKKRNIAKLIYRERNKKPATSWGDIGQMIEDKYDWTLPGSMTGRRLLRDHGPEGAESVIIKQDKSNSTKAKAKDTAKAKATKTRRRAKQVEEEPDEEDEEDEEELEDEEEMEEELDEDEEDEDEDEDEEDEEEEEMEEPQPAPKSRKVRVTRSRKANPSK
jgi:hypothetical protein